MYAQPTLETSNQLIKLADVEIRTEYLSDSLFHQPLDYLLFTQVTYGVQLYLPCSRGDDGGEITHPRRCLALLETDSPANRVAHHVLIIGDRDSHAHSGTLADVGALSSLTGDLCDDLRHVLREYRLDALSMKWNTLSLHDENLMLKSARVVGPNLRTNTIFQRGNDTPTIGIVLRIGADHDKHI